MANKRILLIEPGYKNKYMPLGLMKIAQYHGPEGKRDHVRFIKGNDPSVLMQSWDRIYVTTLFSFEWKKTAETIDFAIQAANGQTDKVFAGGIAASLMNERFCAQTRWRGVRFLPGLLDQAPAISLQLDDFAEELYCDDTTGTPIEDLVPDYSILDHIDYQYPVTDAYLTYASRGCSRKCTFCGVPKLEGGIKDTNPIRATVEGVSSRYGEKRHLILMDNNVVASPKFQQIIDEIVDLGFHAGATLNRDGKVLKRRVDFNQGVDARILCKDPMYLREISRIAIDPLRIAFDHVGMKKPYEQAVRYAADNQITKLSNYMLYNYMDSVADLYERMAINVRLNEELGLRIYSFPMRYQPVDLPDRSHIGKHWHRYMLRSFQIMLQATHGIVSGSPEYFRWTFGENAQAFEELLLWPHHFIFNREWFSRYGGVGEREAYQRAMLDLSGVERDALMAIILHPDATPTYLERSFQALNAGKVRNALHFYLPLDAGKERSIWQSMKSKRQNSEVVDLPIDVRVEDAGLDIAV